MTNVDLGVATPPDPKTTPPVIDQVWIEGIPADWNKMLNAYRPYRDLIQFCKHHDRLDLVRPVVEAMMRVSARRNKMQLDLTFLVEGIEKANNMGEELQKLCTVTTPPATLAEVRAAQARLIEYLGALDKEGVKRA